MLANFIACQIMGLRGKDYRINKLPHTPLILNPVFPARYRCPPLYPCPVPVETDICPFLDIPYPISQVRGVMNNEGYAVLRQYILKKLVYCNIAVHLRHCLSIIPRRWVNKTMDSTLVPPV